ncbi:MAG: heavy metal translocating P-type ATPase [Flavobacteriales bacterium]|nr:heavy metal translocating P-type ATPase [Flavobacteriales bacterium]
MSSSVDTLVCYHCGDPCKEEHLHAHGHEFCCPGCKAVYELLQESGLCDYYALSEQPGVKEKGSGEGVREDLLDLPEVRARFLEFSEGGIGRVTFRVPQMHCASCIWLLENLHRVEPAILRSRVRFPTRQLTVTFREEGLSLRGLVALLKRIGYGPDLSTDPKHEAPVGIPRSLYIQLGVAGFCFGNIMLFSFPEYLGADTSDLFLKRGFQFLSFLFSLPVLFVSSTSFFVSAWKGLRAHTINIDQPIALGIVALFARSVVDVLTEAGPGYFDSLAGLIFFLLIGRWYQAHTYRALRFDRGLDDLLPLAVLCKRGDEEVPVPVSELRPGDRILIRDQEMVPVDAMLQEGTGHVDYSFITGEPLPLRRMPGEVIRAGGRQRGGLIELEVLRGFQDSGLKRMWEEQMHGERPLMPRLIDGVARRFTVVVLLIATGAGLYWWGHDSSQVWPVVTAVLIVACPCALALSMPFTYGHAIRILSSRGLFLRDAEVVERLAHIDTVVFDKTGTLTEREAYDVRWEGKELSPYEQALVASLGRHSVHPLSQALVSALRGSVVPAVDVHEHVGRGVEGLVDGTSVRIGSSAFCGGPEQAVKNGDARVHVRINGTWRGAFAMRKRARSDMSTTVGMLRRQHEVHLLTGDVAVDATVAQAFRDPEIHIGQDPVDKTRCIRSLQAMGRRVLMAGDGLNDAGALQQSDVGVTVSESSASLAPSSDAILRGDELATLPHAMRLARRARRIVFASLGISFLYNVVGVSFAVSGHLTPLVAAILMPLSSASVVGFVTVAMLLADSRRN